MKKLSAEERERLIAEYGDRKYVLRISSQADRVFEDYDDALAVAYADGRDDHFTIEQLVQERRMEQEEQAPVRVILESPYAGNIKRNETYARKCLRDSLLRGESPFASHLLYTHAGVLDDGKPEERQRGIEAGLLWGDVADATVVYTDLGISPGMKQGIDRANAAGRRVIYRSIEPRGEE